MANNDQLDDNKNASGAQARQKDLDQRAEERGAISDDTDTRTDPDTMKS